MYIEADKNICRKTQWIQRNYRENNQIWTLKLIDNLRETYSAIFSSMWQMHKLHFGNNVIIES
jgi:hypothetical protein